MSTKTVDEILSELEEKMALTHPTGWVHHADKEGKEITMHKCMELHRDESYWKIAYTELGNGVRISTVWLGINHGFGGGPPVVFETMAFENGEAGECFRYTNEEDAKKGHEEMVALVKQRMKGRRLDVDEDDE